MANNSARKWKDGSSYDCCFNIGSVVLCRTCYQKEIEGEVLAYDSQTKILILKCPASDGNQSSLCDVNFVNLSQVSHVEMVKEASPVPASPHSLSIQRLNHRLKNNIDNKRRQITALKSGVSPEGTNLFLTISKTIPDIKWDGLDIIVYNELRITPPYKPENIVGNATDNTSYTHIRKVVEKHTKEAQSAKKEIQTTNNNNICVNTTNNSSNHSSCAAPLPQ